MTKQILIGAAIVIVCVLVAAALVASRPDPPQRPVEAQVPLVEAVPADIRTGTLKVTGSGTVRPRAEVALAAQVSGKVVYVSPALVSGAFVRKDEVLVRIDDSDFLNAVEQAKADVAQQEVSVLEAEEEAQLARSEYERFRIREARRVTDPYASIDSNDYAARVLPSAARDSAATGDERSLAQPGGLVFREPQRRAAQAALQRSRAQQLNADLALHRTVVRAPFSGFVRSKNVAVGSFLSPGQSFAQLVASDVHEVRIPLTREEAALIPDLWAGRGGSRNGATVYAAYGGLGYRWPGYIDRAEAVLDPETRTINVVIRVPSPVTSGELVDDAAFVSEERSGIIPSQAPPLLVGEFVAVEIEGAALDRYLALPRSALRSDDNVWVVRDGELQIIPVQVLQQANDTAFVLSDAVLDGDQIVISDLSVVTHGMKVRVPEEGGDRPSDHLPSSSQPAGS